jgi:SSS family solute:Na+ symporter
MELMKGGLFQKIQSMQAYISPPIAAVFLIGIFSRKITAKAAKISLITGGVIGAIRLSLEIVQEKLVAAGDSLPEPLAYFTEINFLHFAVLLFCISVFVLIFFSKIKDEKPLEEIKDITYERGVSVTEKSSLNVWLSVILVICVIALWVIFT